MSGTADKPPSAGLLIEVPPPTSLKRRYNPSDSPGYFSNNEEGTGAERATAARQFIGIETPTTRALGIGADTVDLERAKLVEALQETFKAHMNKKIASTDVDTNYFIEANIVLEKVKAYLKEELKDIYYNLDIDDAGLRLILIEINTTLHNIEPTHDDTLDEEVINPDIIDETISNIVNKHIPTSEIVHQASNRQRQGGKTNRKHKTNRRKHKTNRRKHRTNRKNKTHRKKRTHRKTRKN